MSESKWMSNFEKQPDKINLKEIWYKMFSNWKLLIGIFIAILSTAKRSLEDLRNTRTNMMQSKLRKVGTLDQEESDRLLDLKQVDEAQEQPSE